MHRVLVTALVSLALVVPGSSAAAQAATPHHSSPPSRSAAHHQHVAHVSVSGAVADPASYTATDLDALPQTTLPLAHSHRTVTGVALDELVGLSSPQYGSGHNALLAGQITVRGAFGQRVTFAAGELDPSFGNHRALVTPGPLGIRLTVPGDAAPLRSAFAITSITVSRSSTATRTPAHAGDVTVFAGRRAVTLPARLLARLPQRTTTVTYQSGSGAQTHTERGPLLSTVLLTAGIVPTPNTVVTAVGDDGYAASVTIGEALVGERQLLLSVAEDGTALGQPRLITRGDVKGGRYVSGVVALDTQH